MSFEELGALFEARDIKVEDCEETKYTKESSKQARNFGLSGSVAESVRKSLRDEDSIKPNVINGLNKDTIKELKKFAKDGEYCDGCNMVEVICCEGGCIAGNATMNPVRTAKKMIDALAAQSDDIEKI